MTDTTTIIGAACDGTTDDTTTMSGAQFQRHAGTDAQKWAEAMDKEAGALWTETDGVWPRNHEERIGYLARWLRDYAEVRVAEEVGRVTARLVPRQE